MLAPVPELPVLLNTIGQELASLGAMAEALQDALAPVQPKVDLQVLDMMTQHLVALAAVLQGIAAGDETGLRTTLDSIQLGELKRRLRGLPPAAELTVPGEPDWFGHG